MPNTPSPIPDIDDWLERVELGPAMDVPLFVSDARQFDRIDGTDGYLARRYEEGGDTAAVALAALRARSVRLARVNGGGMVMSFKGDSAGRVRDAAETVTFEQLSAPIEVRSKADLPKVGRMGRFIQRGIVWWAQRHGDLPGRPPSL